MDNNELQHHGVKGMRWGVRRTPEQLGHKPSSPRKKKRFFFKKPTVKKAPKRLVETEKKEPVKKELDIEKKKEEILKARSAKELYKNADLFTTQELQSAYNRLVLERNISSLAPAEVSRGKEFVDKAVKFGKKTNEVLDTGIKLYNNVGKIYNMFNEPGKKDVKLFKEDNKKDKEDD